MSNQAYGPGKGRRRKSVGCGNVLTQSVAAANVGYTLFLFPLGAIVFPKRIPFTLANALALVALDSLAGLLLGLLVLFLRRWLKISLMAASGIAVALLWLLYWLPYLKRNLDVLMLASDAIAAAITWAMFMYLSRRRDERSA